LRRSRLWTVAGPLVAAVLVAGAVAVGAWRAPAPAALVQPSTRSAGVVVLLGTSGLRWSDVDRRVTPAIWDLAEHGLAGAMSVGGQGSSPCALTGWLTLGAGVTAGAGADCTRPPSVTQTGQVNQWDDIDRRAEAGPFRPRLGQLADTLAAKAIPVIALGQDAPLAASSSSGRLARWAPMPATNAGVSAQVRSLLAQRHAGQNRPSVAPALLLVDVGGLTDVADGTIRGSQAARLDARVNAVLRALPSGATAVLASLTDPGASAHLQVLTASVPAGTRGLLGSRSTRQPELVQLTDLPYTLVSMFALAPPTDFLGGALTVASQQQGAAMIAHLGDLDRAAVAVQPVVLPFFVTLVLAQIVVFSATAVVWSRTRRRPGARRRATGRRALAAAQLVGLVGGAVPVATYLANLLPWWQAGSPQLALVVIVLGLASAVGTAAYLGPWRARLLGPAAAVSLLTVAVLVADTLLGSRLQRLGLLGLQPLIGGRFYGVGNVALGVQVCATVLLAGAMAGRPARTGSRVTAVALVSMVGSLVVLVDVAPMWGAKLGAVPVLVPALAYLALRLAKLRVSFKRALLVVVWSATILAVACIADYLRPPASRGHLGRFVASVLDGQAGVVIVRKASQDLDLLLTAPLAILMPLGVVLVAMALHRPARWRAFALAEAYQHCPELPAALGAILLAVSIGAVVNDTGVAIPPVASLVLLPLLVAIAANTRAATLALEPPTISEQQSAHC
jgi:hypothetical protein